MQQNGNLLLASSFFMTWLTSITQSQIIGFLTILVLIATLIERYYSIQNKRNGRR